MQIVAFAGLAKCGKTTAARALAEWGFNNGFSPVLEHFAGPLKTAADTVGFKKGSAYDTQYREFCQQVGSTARKLHPDWWVRMMSERLDSVFRTEAEHLEDDTPYHERLVIIDDVRYLNEITLLQEYQATIVFICAATRLTDLDADWRHHESERVAMEYTQGNDHENLFDYQVDNNRISLAQFEQNIQRLGPTFTRMTGDSHLV
jgi:hypothetical protein